MTPRAAVAKLLMGHHTAADAAAIAGVSVSYARTIRRDLVAVGHFFSSSAFLASSTAMERRR